MMTRHKCKTLFVIKNFLSFRLAEASFVVFTFRLFGYFFFFFTLISLKNNSESCAREEEKEKEEVKKKTDFMMNE